MLKPRQTLPVDWQMPNSSLEAGMRSGLWRQLSNNALFLAAKSPDIDWISMNHFAILNDIDMYICVCYISLHVCVFQFHMQYTLLHIHIHTYTHTHIHACMHACIHTNTYMHACMHTCIHAYLHYITLH